MAAERALIGSTIGRYRIVAELGRGGMAVVYRGEDVELGRAVAVKVMHAHLEDTPEAMERFRREARAVAALKHPHVIEIYDYAPAEDGRPAYLVMELCEGPSLQRYIQEHGTPLPEVGAMIGAHIARALACAHERGIIHRDIKPENVLLDHGGRLVLTDFGIARVAGSETLTETGALVGSPAYMSPEQAKGEPLDVRSDVFSCGALLYRLTTGALPFAGKDPLSTALAILKGDYTPPGARNPRMAVPLERVIRKCLQADRRERYAGAAELAAALEGVCAADGLEDQDAELGRYFADPAAYNGALGARVAAACLTRARAAVAARQWARAGAECNRLLALDPDHAEAQAIVDRLGRGQRGRKVATAAAGALAVCGFAAAAALVWPRLFGPAPGALARDAAPAGVAAAAADAGAAPVDAAGAAPVDAAGAAVAAADAGARVAVTPGARGERPRVVAPLGALVDAGAARPRAAILPDAAAAVVAPPPPPVPVSVLIKPWCTLSVDGRLAGRVPPARELRLAPGPHRLVCTQEPTTRLRWEKTVEVKPGLPITINEPLVTSAEFRVAVSDGDQVHIDGRTYGRGTHRIRPGTHKVTVLKGGVAAGEGVIDISAARTCVIVDVPRVQCAP
ncbi:MAG TPA: serine/threonine-protein kinase [Polyangia bacterium]